MKKIMISIITLIIVMGAFTTGNGQVIKNQNFDDSLEILQKAGIVSVSEEQGFDAEGTVTRAKFSEYVGKMLNIVPDYSMQYFTDVSEQTEYSEYINVLTDMGIISLNQERIFNPERAIKYSEACKMLLCAMGYSDYATMSGEPMNTWVNVAGEAGIGINVANPEMISGQEAVMMIFKAMTEPLMIKNNGEVKVDKNANLFSEYHDIYFDEGAVLATEDAYLERFSIQMPDMAIVGNEEFITEINLSGNLGCIIEYAYRYDSRYGEKTLFFAKPENDEDVLKISSELLKAYDEKNNTFTLYKDENTSKTYSEKIEKEYQIILNGVPYQKSVTNAVKGFVDGTRRGYLTLSDSDSDGTFDIIIVKSYEVFPSGTIDAENESIYGGFKQSVINYKNAKSVKFLDTKGEEKELVNISDAILNIAVSENEEVVEIVLAGENEVISVNSVLEDESKIFTSTDKAYRVDKRVMSQNKDVLMSYKSIKAYLDMFGYIVRFEPVSEDDYMVGYLVSGRCFEDDNGAFKILLNVYCRDGKLVKFEVSDRVKIDEVAYNMSKNPKDAVRAIPNNIDDANVINIGPQVIRYKLTEDKKISAIDTTELSGNEDKHYSLVPRHKNAPMLNTNRVGLDTYWSSAETNVFTVPTLNERGQIYKNNAYVEPKASDFSTSVTLSYDHTYSMDTYNYSDDDCFIDIMVVVKDQSTLTPEVHVFTGISQAWDETEGDALAVVKAIRSGGNVSYKLNKGVEAKLKDFKYGDLFYISLDGSGVYGVDVKRIFNSETLKFIHSGNNDYWYYGEYSPYSNWSYRTGEDNRHNLSKMYVLKKRSDALFGSYEYANLEKEVYEEIMRVGSIPVVIIDREGESVEKGSYESILSYEDIGEGILPVLVESYAQTAKSVIVYK